MFGITIINITLRNILTTAMKPIEGYMIMFISSFGFMGLTLGITLLQEALWMISLHLFLPFFIQ